MSDLKEEFKKINEYTIAVINEIKEPIDNGINRKRTVTRTFNFLSSRLSENFETCIYEGRGKGSDASGTSAISSQVFIDNFKDLPSYEEIKFMHKKLLDLGGNPPSLFHSLPIINKRRNN